MKTLILATLLAALAAIGCQAYNGPSKTHVLSGTITATKLGVHQNLSGAYDAGLQRGMVWMTSVPIVYATNQNGSISAIVPDVVIRVEGAGGKGGLLPDRAAYTWTFATGTNATYSAVGGSAPPINAQFSSQPWPAGVNIPGTSNTTTPFPPLNPPPAIPAK